jgi:hypothetical protein
VDHQQAGDQLVGGEPVARLLVLDQLDDPLETGAVHLHDRAGELLGQLAAPGVVEVLQPSRELLHTGYELLGLHRLSRAPSVCGPPS